MDFEFTTMAIVIAVVFVGALIQGSIGFGLGLVVVPVLVQLDPGLVPGPVLLVMLVLSLGIGWRDGRSVDRGALIVPIGGQLLGIVLALAILSWVDTRVLSIMIGVLVGFAVFLSWIGLRPSPTPASLLLAGTLSGFMGATASIPGPPLALLHQHVSPARLRGTMAHFLAVGNAAALIGLAWSGRLGLSEVGVGLALIPAVLAGYVVSGMMIKRVDGPRLRLAVLTFSALAAAVLIYRSI